MACPTPHRPVSRSSSIRCNVCTEKFYVIIIEMTWFLFCWLAGVSNSARCRVSGLPEKPRGNTHNRQNYCFAWLWLPATCLPAITNLLYSFNRCNFDRGRFAIENDRKMDKRRERESAREREKAMNHRRATDIIFVPFLPPHLFLFSIFELCPKCSGNNENNNNNNEKKVVRVRIDV